jgi:hypothetical protein
MVSDADWQWGISNIGAGKLLIWLEPWAEEFDVESRSTATLRVSNPACNDRCLDVETTNNHIVVWARGGDLAGQQFEQQAPVSFWGRLKRHLGLS